MGHRSKAHILLLALPLTLAGLNLASCSRKADEALTLHVAAAGNLARLFPELARACRRDTGLTLVPSLGNTAQLAQQIESGAPFDLFLAADVAHVRGLESAGRIAAGSVRNYAQGRLVVYAPRHDELQTLEDLRGSSIRKIGIAKPELAPYGSASVEALTKANLWSAVERKVVYGQNISAVLQFVDSSNVDAAFTAMALVYDRPGNKIEIDPNLYTPIDQALGVVAKTARRKEAERAALWFVSQNAQSLFSKAGYAIGPQHSGSFSRLVPGTLKP